MDPEFIEALIEILRRHAVQEIDYQDGAQRLRIRLGPGMQVAVEQLASPMAPAAAASVDMRAPMAAVFYRASMPGAVAFVSVGDRVVPGQTLALLEAMKMMVPLLADTGGIVLAIPVADGSTVGRGEVLFVLAPED